MIYVNRKCSLRMAVAIAWSVAFVSPLFALTNPEDFERFNVGDKLTIAEGWSGNVGGTTEPVSNETATAIHTIASIPGPDGDPTKAVLIQTSTFYNMALNWQQKISDLGEPSKVVFGFDALTLDNVPGVPSRVMVRSANDTFFWAINDPNDGPAGTVNLYLAPTSNILSPPNIVDGTWYRYELLMDIDNNTVAPRYGVAGTSLGPFGAAFPAGNSQFIDVTEPFVLFSSDTVYYDNFSLSIPSDSVPGDYNADGSVDAADYTVWRDDPSSHGGTPDGYDTWKANFGNTSGSGGSVVQGAAVPEPASILIAFLLLLGLADLRCRT